MNDAGAGDIGATGGRRGALIDIAIWLGVMLLGLVSGRLFSHADLASGRIMAVAAPIHMLILFGVATALLRWRGEGWRSVGLARPVSIRRTAGLIVGGYIGLIAINAVLVTTVFPALGLAHPAFGAFGALKGDVGRYAYWLVMAWVSAGLGEELQFRGFLWSRLNRLFGGGRAAGWTALGVQAVLFGLGHMYQGLSGVLVTTTVGLMLGVIFLAGRRNLVACIVLHGMVDTISLTVLFLGAIPPGAVG